MSRRTRVFLVVCALALVAPLAAFARPGGGQSYSGGGSKSSGGGGSKSSGGGSSSSRSSGGGSSGGGSPLGGLVVVIICLGVVALMKAMNKPTGGFTTGYSGNARPYQPLPLHMHAPAAPVVPARTRLRALEAHDPAFSVIVFEDFVSALYTETVLAAGQGNLERFGPYLGEGGRRVLATRPLQGVSHVLVGAMKIDDVDGLEANAQHVTAHVVFETNLARRDPASGHEQAIYSMERWSFRRAKNVKSRAPDKARVFGCPSCSAPLEQILAGKCKYCGNDVSTGAFDWTIANVEILQNLDRGPMLTGNTEEQGNELPTVVDARARSRIDDLARRDPAFSYSGFLARVSHVFHTFHATWSARDLAAMRPYLSDALFTTQTYWVSEYLRQRLRNVSEQATVLSVELARVTSDTYFDAITVRIYASCLDYTLSDDGGALVSGNRSAPRRYTEYWTFIRGREAKGPARVDRVCPRCGAPLAINMSGNCTHCQAKVTAGGFDWVLSRIEQDEVYAG